MTKHNIKPDFIFVYRDGVAESQLNQVVSNVTLGMTRVMLIEFFAETI
jgi:hypothetical protein